MFIKTSDNNLVRSYLRKLNIPKPNSHKGQNGKVLIIGGSKLFHSASIWAAEIASHFVDMVHYSSTEENNEIVLSLKKMFRNGIVVHHKDIPTYVVEDNAVLVGPGMVRNRIKNSELRIQNFEELLQIKNEAEFTRKLVYYLISTFPDKQFVFDAGALQMMDAGWLLKLTKKAIITPQQAEFERLFGISIKDKTNPEKILIVDETAKKYNCVIMLKAIIDIISDGTDSIIVEGGNAGLTKGGTGDLLAGLTTAFSGTNDPIDSAVFASLLIKKTADKLMKVKGLWYAVSDIMELLPGVLHKYTSK